MEELLRMQKGEITEHQIYHRLADRTKDAKNKGILERIADDELKHYELLRNLTKQELGPDSIKAGWYVAISSLFGLTFGLKLMENEEGSAKRAYTELRNKYPELEEMMRDETAHEKILLDMLSEERLEYASAIVLGLNDAIVEFTGTLSGLTFAIADGRMIGITGLVMGVAASLSMAASSYLSAREEGNKNAYKSLLYTGIAYILTVLVMVSPYFIFKDVYIALGTLIAFTLLIIAGYSFYIAVAKNQDFRSKFLEMAGISLGVAVVTFIFGSILKALIGINA